MSYMLDEIKKIYEDSADLYFPDWRKCNKNEAVLLAIEHKNKNDYDGYIGAIMTKYWPKLCKYYNRCKLVVTPEDVHSWLSQAVMYAIERHPWTNENSSIYGDKNAPDKVINRVMESRRLTFYQQLNRYNRKINSALISLDSLSEDMADTYTPISEDEHTFIIDDLVIKAFEAKDYFTAFFVDAIESERFNVGGRHKKLVTHLSNLDSHCDIFANRYGLSMDSVRKASTYITRLDRDVIKKKIDTTLNDMKRKMAQEQSDVCGDFDSCSSLYNINEIVEFYYVDLWNTN